MSGLKVDRSFIEGLPYEREDAALVEAILAIARGLHLPVVAEGVESEAQLAWLREAGCAMVQGYLFAPALPAEELEGFVRGWRGVRGESVDGLASGCAVT